MIISALHPEHFSYSIRGIMEPGAAPECIPFFSASSEVAIFPAWGYVSITRWISVGMTMIMSAAFLDVFDLSVSLVPRGNAAVFRAAAFFPEAAGLSGCL